jgi:RNA polymerase sigma-70 factor, ECF subfamily
MASSFQGAMGYVSAAPAVERRRARYSAIYKQHCHRIYSLAFWMTDNELVAEQLAQQTFLRCFALSADPRTEQLDQAFLAEVRESTPVGALTLAVHAGSKNLGGNVKRIDLERAVVQLPATEKLIFLYFDVEGYDHERISSLLGISPDESRFGLHQARLRIRELVSQMR